MPMVTVFSFAYALRRWPENETYTNHFCRNGFRYTPWFFHRKIWKELYLLFNSEKLHLIWFGLYRIRRSMYSVACRLTFFSPTVKYNFKLYINILSQYILDNLDQTILLVFCNNQAQTCLIPFGCGSGTSVDFKYVPSFNTFICFWREIMSVLRVVW